MLTGNDEDLARALDLGCAGGICVSSHIVGNEMRRMFDEPERRAEIDASLRDVYDAMFCTASPIPVKTALNLLGPRRRRPAAAAGGGRRVRAARSSAAPSSATDC